MFIFDQLKRNDKQLRVVAIGLLIGLAVLLAGLWRVQILSARDSRRKQERQSLRPVIIPAVRGKIFDRNGQVLAENRPRYDIVLFLEEMRAEFHRERTNTVVKEYRQAHPTNIITETVKTSLALEAAYRVVSNTTAQVTSFLGNTTTTLDRKAFVRRYNDLTYVPFPIMANLNPKQMALFSEQLSSHPSMELEVQPVRVYPHGSTAAHILGYVQRSKMPNGGDDYSGQMGAEARFDPRLRGDSGTNWVVINSSGYRQSEETEVPARPGEDIYLTIDLELQRAAEKALGANTRGAAVVMDVNNGDVLALASAPTYDPNAYLSPLSAAEQTRLNDPFYTPTFNRATFGKYPPGSTFKIITAIACLESGVLDPNEKFYSPGVYTDSSGHQIRDTAGSGDFDFNRAFYKSSNTYFIHYGLKAGLRKLAEVGRRFHFGEKTDIATRQEVPGAFPKPEQVGHRWRVTQTADICIGQEVAVTPIQVAVFTAAIANGGTVFWPRIVSNAILPGGATTNLYAAGHVRDHAYINPQHLAIIHQAMFLDTEDPNGTAHPEFFNGASLPFRVAGKTGTAQVDTPRGKDHITWFVSFSQSAGEKPRYAVVVMVESGASGGKTCAPIARRIYDAIAKHDQPVSPKTNLAQR